MSIQPVKTEGLGGQIYFQTIDNTLRGGVALVDGLADAKLTDGQVIPAGTAIAVDEVTREATLAVVDAEDGSNATGLLLREVTFTEDGENIIDVVIVGIVYQNRIPENAVDHAEALPRITFSKSF